MNKFFKVMLSIIMVLTALIIFSALNFYFPNNIIAKIVKGAVVVITPVLIALVIMYLINPMAQSFMKKFKFKKRAAIGCAMGIFFVIIIALFGFVGYFISQQGKLLYEQVTDPMFLESIKNWFDNNNLTGIYTGIVDFIKNFDISILFGSAASIVTRVLQLLAAIILAPIFLWHFMNNQEIILTKVTENIPEKWADSFVPILEDSNKVIVRYFRSKIISIVILFFMFLVLYLGLGLPVGYAVLFSILIASLDLVPYLGPAFGSIIPIIYLFSAGGTNLLYNQSWHVNALLASIIMLGINVLFQYIQGNLIVPALIGKEMEINSGMILVFMLFFGYVLGFWGILLAIPLGGIFIVIWQHIKDSGILVDKDKIKNIE